MNIWFYFLIIWSKWQNIMTNRKLFKSKLLSNIIASSVSKLMTILALFSTGITNTKGKSALTTSVRSVVIVPLTPATSTGTVTHFIDDLTSPPSNLNVLLGFSSVVFFLYPVFTSSWRCTYTVQNSFLSFSSHTKAKDSYIHPS